MAFRQQRVPVGIFGTLLSGFGQHRTRPVRKVVS